MDTNKDGVVTIEELVQWCSKDEQLLRSLDTLDTVLWDLCDCFVTLATQPLKVHHPLQIVTIPIGVWTSSARSFWQSFDFLVVSNLPFIERDEWASALKEIIAGARPTLFVHTHLSYLPRSFKRAVESAMKLTVLPSASRWDNPCRPSGIRAPVYQFRWSFVNKAKT